MTINSVQPIFLLLKTPCYIILANLNVIHIVKNWWTCYSNTLFQQVTKSPETHHWIRIYALFLVIHLLACICEVKTNVLHHMHINPQFTVNSRFLEKHSPETDDLRHFTDFECNRIWPLQVYWCGVIIDCIKPLKLNATSLNALYKK